MTDDLVKRLRSPEVFIDTGGMFSPVANEAADRIEKLEKAYAQQQQVWSDAIFPTLVLETFNLITGGCSDVAG